MATRGDPEKRRIAAAKWRLENAAAYREKNRERIRGYQRKYREANKEKCNAANRKYRSENAEFVMTTNKKTRSRPEHKVYMASKCREYQAKKRNAVPPWADSEFEKMALIEAYDLAKRREAITGFAWHVDHIVPIQNKSVCGLHCIANLRVIPGVENLSKGNRHWPDMP